MNTRTPLRIGYLVQQFPPEVGAGPARVTEMALRWQQAGAEVTVITGMPNRPVGRIHPDYRGKLFHREDWKGIRVHRSWLYASPKHGFARTILNNASFMVTSAMNALLHAGRFDILIASSPPFFPHLTGELLRRVRRTPLVLEIRDLWPDYLVGMGVLREGAASRALFGLERRLLSRAAHTVVVTESFRERVVEKGVPREAIDVIPNGVDTTQYFPSEEKPSIEEMRRRNGEMIVGYMGNFGAGQGLTSLVEAAAMLREEGGIKFVLVGDGPDRERIMARARELKTDNLSIHGPITKDETRAFYNACDICLVPLAPFPILQETIPSKIFEVMACARPLVASLGGEGAGIVQRSGAGVVTSPGRPEEIAAAVRTIRDMDAGKRAQLGARGREYVEEHYSREHLADSYLRLLRRVVEDGGRTREAPDFAT
jgi:glycosyltransferase involved in cell wall biosynthesis